MELVWDFLTRMIPLIVPFLVLRFTFDTFRLLVFNKGDY